MRLRRFLSVAHPAAWVMCSPSSEVWGGGRGSGPHQKLVGTSWLVPPKEPKNVAWGEPMMHGSKAIATTRSPRREGVESGAGATLPPFGVPVTSCKTTLRVLQSLVTCVVGSVFAAYHLTTECVAKQNEGILQKQKFGVCRWPEEAKKSSPVEAHKGANWGYLEIGSKTHSVDGSI